MKKRIKIVVCGILAATMLIPSFSVSAATVKSHINAQMVNTLALKNNISSIEDNLEADKTDIAAQLKSQLSDYQSLLASSTTQPRKKQISGLIFETSKLLSSYNGYKNRITIDGVTNPVYTPAVAAVVAYFNFRGYKLAAELLTHAADNNIVDSYYYPTYGDRVKSSSVFQNIVKNSPNGNGSSAFPNNGSTIDRDLYYAIHSFNYTKSSCGTIEITDRYDYALGNYSGLTGIAIDTMYAAQTAGVIVPYQVDIVESF